MGRKRPKETSAGGASEEPHLWMEDATETHHQTPGWSSILELGSPSWRTEVAERALGALCRNRTDDLFLTMEMLYRLS